MDLNRIRKTSELWHHLAVTKNKGNAQC
jgi:hypothetical protein